FEGSFKTGNLLVLSVHRESAEAGAGLERGDRILGVNGRPIHTARDWEATRANTEVGISQRWEILRGDKRLELTVPFPRLEWRVLMSAYIGTGEAYLLFLLASMIVGLVIAFRRPFDPVARM